MKLHYSKPQDIKPTLPDTDAPDCICRPLQQIVNETYASYRMRQAARN